MLLELSGKGALYDQIYVALKARILSGGLRHGAQLPSSRTLAQDLGVSRNVVLLAYDILLAEGYTETRRGAGTFVRSLAARPVTDARANAVKLSRYGERALALRPDVPYPVEVPDLPYDFRYGRLPPDEALQKMWRRALNHQVDAAPTDYQDPQGYPPLRQALAAYLSYNRGVKVSSKHVLITSGSQQALDLYARVLLEPGDGVLLEDPHYRGARQVFEARGARLSYAPVDAEGMVVPLQTSARLAYVTPSHQFPRGSVMSLSRRFELLAWAERHGAFILEDDYDSEYRYEGRPLPAVQGLDNAGRVIYLGTFSKLLFPALRLGFMVLPETLLAPFRAAKWLSDRFSPTLEQAALAELLQQGYFLRHVRRSRRRNALRREALLEALEPLGDRVRVEGSNAGLHLLLWFDDIPSAAGDDFSARARQSGVGVYPITPYFVQPPERLGLLMGYSVLDEGAIREGVRRLAALL